MWNDFWREFIMFTAGFFALCFIVFAITTVVVNSYKNDYREVKEMAEDLGCTYIEQSNHNKDNFYIDCGDDEIRIIKMEK